MHEKIKTLLACISFAMQTVLCFALGVIVQNTHPVAASVVYAFALCLGCLYWVSVRRSLSCGKSLGELYLGNKYFDLALCFVYPPFFLLVLDGERWELFGMAVLVCACVDAIRVAYKL